MSYADGLLSTGEVVVHRERQHWLVFVWGARYTILAAIAAVLLAVLTSGMTGDGAVQTVRDVLAVLIVVLFVAAVANLGWTVLRYLNQEYVITNRRVMQVSGVLNKSSTDSSLEKINDAQLTQSIFGRILGFGDLDILTAAETGVDRFRMLIDPVRFKVAMLDAKHEYERDMARDEPLPGPPLRNPAAAATPVRASGAAGHATEASDDTLRGSLPGGPAPAAMSADDVTRTLSSLAELRDRGAISHDEYERKKADLLGRL
ncbi:MAG: PH domain-containing protein [Candidatus Limnocylindria bacterium]